MKEKKNLQGCSINNHKSRPQEYGVENFVATQHLKQQTWFQTVTKKKKPEMSYGRREMKYRIWLRFDTDN